MTTRKFSPKSIQPVSPVAPPKLNVPCITANDQLKAEVDKGYELVNCRINSEEDMEKADRDGESWREYAIRLLAMLFDNSSLSDEFRDQTRPIGIGGHIPYLEEREIFKSLMTGRVRKLKSIQDSLNLYMESPTLKHIITGEKDLQADALEKIELIAKRFHLVARQLRQRHAERVTFRINDEYDVQDLFRSLLKLFFDDVRAEEPTQSHAGGGSRIDFLLKAEQICIELKMARVGLKDKQLSEELIVDIERYSTAHSDCKMFVAFVYDPQGHLDNPKSIERDLTKISNNIPVKVIINSN